MTFEILENVKVRKNAQLRIKSVGFLGDKYLDIILGEGDEVLPSGSLISALEGASLDKIIQDGSELVVEMKQIVRGVRESVAPPGEEPPIKTLLEETNKIFQFLTQSVELFLRFFIGQYQEIVFL